MQHQDNNPAGWPVRSMLDLPTDVPEQLLAFYDEHRILERARAFPGCLAAEWWQPTDGGDPVISALWTGVDRYQAWVDDPWRGRLADGLGALLRRGHPGFRRRGGRRRGCRCTEQQPGPHEHPFGFHAGTSSVASAARRRST